MPVGVCQPAAALVVERTRNPVWRQSVPLEFNSLAEACAGELKVTVWDEDKRRWYELLSLIGKGSTSTVYRARRLSDGRVFAYKLVRLSHGQLARKHLVAF